MLKAYHVSSFCNQLNARYLPVSQMTSWPLSSRTWALLSILADIWSPLCLTEYSTLYLLYYSMGILHRKICTKIFVQIMLSSPHL